MFFRLIEIVSNIYTYIYIYIYLERERERERERETETEITHFFGNLTKDVGTTHSPPIPLSYLKEWNGNFDCDFSIKI